MTSPSRSPLTPEPTNAETGPGQAPPGQPDGKRQRLNAVIGQHVLRTLGQPAGLQCVQVRHLWADHYRVNVFVGPDAVSARVAHSYFLVADGGGKVLAATP